MPSGMTHPQTHRAPFLAFTLAVLAVSNTALADGPTVAASTERIHHGETLTPPGAAAPRAPKTYKQSTAGRFTLEVLSNVGGGAIGLAGGAVLGAAGGSVGSALGGTAGLGVGILFIGPAFMVNTAEDYGYQGSYAAGLLGGLVAGGAFALTEVALSELDLDADDWAGARVLGYFVLGPVLQALIFEASLEPLPDATASAPRKASVTPSVSPLTDAQGSLTGGVVSLGGTF